MGLPCLRNLFSWITLPDSFRIRTFAIALRNTGIHLLVGIPGVVPFAFMLGFLPEPAETGLSCVAHNLFLTVDDLGRGSGNDLPGALPSGRDAEFLSRDVRIVLAHPRSGWRTNPPLWERSSPSISGVGSVFTAYSSLLRWQAFRMNYTKQPGWTARIIGPSCGRSPSR